MVNLLDSNIITNKLELQSWHYIHFRTNILGKGMNSCFSPTMFLIVSQLFFYKYGFGIK